MENSKVTVKQILNLLSPEIEFIQINDKFAYPIGNWTVNTCRKGFGKEEIDQLRFVDTKTIEIDLANFY